jgi:ABC-type transporter Mla subunit MlaD
MAADNSESRLAQAVVDVALAERISSLEHRLKRAQNSVRQLRVERNRARAELERIDRDVDVLREAFSRLPPLERGVAEGRLPQAELDEAREQVQHLIRTLAPAPPSFRD